MGLINFKNPAFHNKKQSDEQIGPWLFDNHTPADDARSITCGKFTQQLIYQGGLWYEVMHEEAGTVQYLVPISKTQAIKGTTYYYYDPPFRVRGFIVGTVSTSTAPNSSYCLHYDQPYSYHVIDWFASGIEHPQQLTRVWLGSNTTATRISLIG